MLVYKWAVVFVLCDTTLRMSFAQHYQDALASRCALKVLFFIIIIIIIIVIFIINIVIIIIIINVSVLV